MTRSTTGAGSFLPQAQRSIASSGKETSARTRRLQEESVVESQCLIPELQNPSVELLTKRTAPRTQIQERRRPSGCKRTSWRGFQASLPQTGITDQIPSPAKRYVDLEPSLTPAEATSTACLLLMAFVLLWMQRQPVVDLREGNPVAQAA